MLIALAILILTAVVGCIVRYGIRQTRTHAAMRADMRAEVWRDTEHS